MSEPQHLPDGYDVKNRYDFTCCYCGHRMFFTPNLFMHMGMNMGGGSCISCKRWMHLTIDTDSGLGVSQPVQKNEEEESDG